MGGNTFHIEGNEWFFSIKDETFGFKPKPKLCFPGVIKAFCEQGPDTDKYVFWIRRAKGQDMRRGQYVLIDNPCIFETEDVEENEDLSVANALMGTIEIGSVINIESAVVRTISDLPMVEQENLEIFRITCTLGKIKDEEKYIVLDVEVVDTINNQEYMDEGRASVLPLRVVEEMRNMWPNFDETFMPRDISDYSS